MRRGPLGRGDYLPGCVWLDELVGDWVPDDGVELDEPLVDGRLEVELPILLVEPLVPSPLDALLVVSDPVEGALEVLLLLVVLAPRSELPVTEELLLPGAEDERDALDALEPFWHCCCAAWVLGPITPSIEPGSQPCDLSCCCSWRIESVPALAEADEPIEPLEADASSELCPEDAPCAVRPEEDGACEERLDADWLEGDWVDADDGCEDGEAELVELLLPEVDCAKAVPVASSAATATASFLEVIGCSLIGGGSGDASAVPATRARIAHPRGLGVPFRRHARNSW